MNQSENNDRIPLIFHIELRMAAAPKQLLGLFQRSSHAKAQTYDPVPGGISPTGEYLIQINLAHLRIAGQNRLGNIFFVKQCPQLIGKLLVIKVFSVLGQKTTEIRRRHQFALHIICIFSFHAISIFFLIHPHGIIHTHTLQDIPYNTEFSRQKQYADCIGFGVKIIFQSFPLLGEQYIPERELKSGTNSVVFLVRDRNTHTRYIYREFAGSPEAYMAMQGHSCPHLPKILQVSCHSGRVMALEEFIPGDSLAFLLEGGPLPADQAQTITLHVCRALEALHARGIVHRDIKPENILLRGNEAVVIDFDASRLHKTENPSDTRIMGTTGYAAPEQYGFSQTDARADIYSVGILLNEMLTQKHPATRLAEGPLLSIIEKCIEVNIDRRYQSAAEVIAALDTLLPSQNFLSRRHFRAVFAVILSALVVLLFLFLRKPASPEPGASGEPSTPSPIPEAFFTDTTIEPWAGPLQSDHTEFEYDLDGDGKTETYIFTLGHNLGGPDGLTLFGTDTRILTPGMSSQLVIAPAVMKHTETGLQYVWQFAELLQNQTTTIYRAQHWGSDTPSMGDYGLLDGLWPGAVYIQFEAEDAGIWVYEISAELEGNTLTARGITCIYAANSEPVTDH